MSSDIYLLLGIPGTRYLVLEMGQYQITSTQCTLTYLTYSTKCTLTFTRPSYTQCTLTYTDPPIPLVYPDLRCL